MERIMEEASTIQRLLPWINYNDVMNYLRRIPLDKNHLRFQLTIWHFLKEQDSKNNDSSEQGIEDDAREIVSSMPETPYKLIKERLTVLGNMPNRKEVVIRQLLHEKGDLERLVSELDFTNMNKRKSSSDFHSVDDSNQDNETNIKIKIRKVEGTLEVVSSIMQEKVPPSSKVNIRPSILTKEPSAVEITSSSESDELPHSSTAFAQLTSFNKNACRIPVPTFVPVPAEPRSTVNNHKGRISDHKFMNRLNDIIEKKVLRQISKSSQPATVVNSTMSSEFDGASSNMESEDFDLVAYLQEVTQVDEKKIRSLCNSVGVPLNQRPHNVLLNDILNRIMSDDVIVLEDSICDRDELFSPVDDLLNVGDSSASDYSSGDSSRDSSTAWMRNLPGMFGKEDQKPNIGEISTDERAVSLNPGGPDAAITKEFLPRNTIVLREPRFTLPTSKPSTITADPKPSTVIAGPKPSTITANPKPSTVQAGPKPSTVTADPKPSTITAGSKPSTITAGPKFSTLSGGPKPSTITADPKPSTITAGSKPSTITAGSKPSTITAGPKFSTISGGPKPSTITADPKPITADPKPSTVTAGPKPSTVTSDSTGWLVEPLNITSPKRPLIQAARFTGESKTSGATPAVDAAFMDSLLSFREEPEPQKNMAVAVASSSHQPDFPKESAGQVGRNEDVTAKKRKVVDEKLVLRIIEMFPQACPEYVRSVCQNKTWHDFDDVLNVILSAEDYPKRRPPSPPVEVDLEKQLEIVKDLLPDADPTYLRVKCELIGNNPEQLNEFICEARETKNYPTMKEYLRKQKLSAQSKQYTTEFNVENFVELFPDPEKTFTDPKRIVNLSENYTSVYITNFFQNKYDKLHKRIITTTLNKNNFRIIDSDRCMAEAVKTTELRNRRKHSPPLDVPQNIMVLQEIAYLTHKEEIEEFIKEKKLKEQMDRQCAKDNGLMNTCQCCFDEEVMPKDTFYCPKECMFCRDCILRSCEVALGEGKTQYRCLNDCTEELSLKTLQNVLPPKMFSKLAQKKSLEEVKAAGIPELEMCPFCDFASIPNETDKIFKCLNPDCMKESCRLCKEENHIPYRCDELEKDEEVKTRTFLENKMSEALLRKCWKCGLSFYKEEGCNKMTCPCGAQSCYVCKKPVNDYQHFNGIGGDKYDRCPLYSDTNELNKQNVIGAVEAAKAQIDASKLKVDPSSNIQQHFSERRKVIPREPHLDIVDEVQRQVQHIRQQQLGRDPYPLGRLVHRHVQQLHQNRPRVPALPPVPPVPLEMMRALQRVENRAQNMAPAQQQVNRPQHGAHHHHHQRGREHNHGRGRAVLENARGGPQQDARPRRTGAEGPVRNGGL